VAARAAELESRLAQRDRELAALQRQKVLGEGARLAAGALEIAGRGGAFRVAAGSVAGAGVDELRLLADDLRARLGSGAVLLGTSAGGRGVLLCALTADLVQRGLHAGRVVAAAAAAAGGRGGGRPDLAHAGAGDGQQIGAALEVGVSTLREQAGA